MIKANILMGMEEIWLAGEMAKRMPPELFLRAYGNVECKIDVAKWLEQEGYSLAVHVGGKKQLKRGDEVLTTFDPPKPTIQFSNCRDPFSFSCTPPEHCL